MWWYRNDIDSFTAHILYEDITIYYLYFINTFMKISRWCRKISDASVKLIIYIKWNNH